MAVTPRAPWPLWLATWAASWALVPPAAALVLAVVVLDETALLRARVGGRL